MEKGQERDGGTRRRNSLFPENQSPRIGRTSVR